MDYQIKVPDYACRPSFDSTSEEICYDIKLLVGGINTEMRKLDDALQNEKRFNCEKSALHYRAGVYMKTILEITQQLDALKDKYESD